MNVFETLQTMLLESGFAGILTGDGWKSLVMIVIACVMLYLGIVVAAHGHGRIIQCRQQVALDIANFGGSLLHAVHDVLDMGAVQLHQLQLDLFCGQSFAANAEGFLFTADCIHDQRCYLRQFLPINSRIFQQYLIADILQHYFPVGSYRIHLHREG